MTTIETRETLADRLTEEAMTGARLDLDDLAKLAGRTRTECGYKVLKEGDVYNGRVLGKHEWIDVSMQHHYEAKRAAKAAREAELEAWLDEDDTVYSDEAVDVEML